MASTGIFFYYQEQENASFYSPLVSNFSDREGEFLGNLQKLQTIDICQKHILFFITS